MGQCLFRVHIAHFDTGVNLALFAGFVNAERRYLVQFVGIIYIVAVDNQRAFRVNQSADGLGQVSLTVTGSSHCRIAVAFAFLRGTPLVQAQQHFGHIFHHRRVGYNIADEAAVDGFFRFVAHSRDINCVLFRCQPGNLSGNFVGDGNGKFLGTEFMLINFRHYFSPLIIMAAHCFILTYFLLPGKSRNAAAAA